MASNVFSVNVNPTSQHFVIYCEAAPQIQRRALLAKKEIFIFCLLAAKKFFVVASVGSVPLEVEPFF